MGESGERSPRPETLEEAALEALLNAVSARVRTVQDEHLRWRVLLDAVVTITADLSLEELLRHIVRVASSLLDARYAALGVLGSGGDKRLRTFVTWGLDDAEVAAIGDLPTGHGILGLLIDRPEPLRLRDLGQHPHSVGFPSAHPAMRSFLGVPVSIRGKAFGNLYVTEKQGGDGFTEEDEQVAVALAAAAGVAIENARLHEEAAQRQRWLTATAQITTRLNGEITEEESLQLIADQAREVAGADFAWIVTGPDADRLSLRVVAGTAVDRRRLRPVPMENTIAGSAVRGGSPIVVEDIAAATQSSGFGVVPIKELGPTTMFPLRDTDPDGRADTQGVLALAWRHENADCALDLDPALPAAFAQQVALALRLARARREQRQLALYEDRERIARDLHDVVIQRLFAVGLGLQTVYRRTSDPDLAARIDTAAEDVDNAIRDIRGTIFELGAKRHVDEDVVGELRGIIQRAANALKFRPQLSVEGPVRTAIPAGVVPDLLAVAAESLSNAARHSGATQVTVALRVAHDITLRVVDNGTGIAADVAASGLANMRRRAEQHGGHCSFADATPHGTIVEWSVPLPQPGS